jgi:hypothetical protein
MSNAELLTGELALPDSQTFRASAVRIAELLRIPVRASRPLPKNAMDRSSNRCCLQMLMILGSDLERLKLLNKTD